MLHRVIPVLFAALAVGCGGTTELNGEGSGTDGSAGTRADSTGGAGPTTAGSTSGGATSASTASASVTTVTSVAAATTSGTTGNHCNGVECGGLPCHDGHWEVPAGECCPVCVCSEIACPDVDCPNGRMETVSGHCCPQCVESSCDGVMCSPPSDCASDRSFTRPDGACCSGCMPDVPGAVGCVEIACPDDICAKGFVRGDLMGGCCYECLPDPLFCEQNADCVLADRPHECCGCPEVISRRALDDDACWYSLAEPRTIPPECYPEFTCDALCGACPDSGSAVCVDNRCTQEILE